MVAIICLFPTSPHPQEKGQYERYFWAHTLQCGWGWKFIPWTITKKNGFPKTFDANAKILGRCPCCVRLSPVALRIIEKDWRRDGGRLSIFSRCVGLLEKLVQGGLPTSYKWAYNFYKWPYTWVTGGYNPTSGSYNSIYNDRRAHLVGRAFFVTLQMDL